MSVVCVKLRLIPEITQERILTDTMQAFKSACNEVSEYVYEKKTLSRKIIRADLYYYIREKYGLGAQMAQSVISVAVARYKTEKAKGEWNKCIFKKPQMELVWNRDYSIKNNVVSVNTLNGRIKMKFLDAGFEKYLDGSWKYAGAKIICRHNKWFLHAGITREDEKFKPETVCGIDMGINFHAVMYDGNKTIFVKGRSIKQKRAAYKETRKQLQQRKTPSSRRRLKKIGNRENRWMQNVNHCVSKALVENLEKGTLIVLEDLTGIRKATEKVKRKNRYVQVSWAFYDLRKKIEYKAKLHGCEAIAVNPEYTSQRCPYCGHTEKSNRNRRNHLFQCKSCGYSSNDDRTAAMNLYLMGKEYLDTVAHR